MNKTAVIRLLMRLMCDILILLFVFGFILSLCWYKNGSLEMMPTEEQQEKAQMAAVFSMIVTGLPCMICVLIRRRMK